jgi:hypothetical protein
MTRPLDGAAAIEKASPGAIIVTWSTVLLSNVTRHTANAIEDDDDDNDGGGDGGGGDDDGDGDDGDDDDDDDDDHACGG